MDIIRRGVMAFLVGGFLVALLGFLFSDRVVAMPLPKVLIEEVRVSKNSTEVEFKGLGSRVVEGSRHLVLDIYGVVDSRSEGVSLAINLNGSYQPEYSGRTLSSRDGNIETELSTKSESASVLPLSDDEASELYGVRTIIPWAFSVGMNKHLLTQAVSGGSMSNSMANWASQDSIDSLVVGFSGGDAKFLSGSVIRLYAVDESYRLDERDIPWGEGDLRFDRLSQASDDLMVLGQTRSNTFNPLRRGDRVWYSVNGDTNSQHYQAQRITGESYPVGQTPKRSDSTRKLLFDQIVEPRLGWNPDSSNPGETFGPWLVYFPEYTSRQYWKSFMSLHGVYDGSYNPVGSEFGAWRSSDGIRFLGFYPNTGSGFESGSSIGIYKPAPASSRQVLDDDQGEIVFDIPEGVDELEFSLTARSLDRAFDDRVLIEIDDEADSRRSHAMESLREGPAVRDSGLGVVGRVPGSAAEDLIRSNIYGVVRGVSDGYSSLVHSYGGVAGVGSNGFYGVESLGGSAVRRVTFRLESGRKFSAGSVVKVWMTGGQSESRSGEEGRIDLRHLVFLGVMALVTILAITVQARQARLKL